MCPSGGSAQAPNEAMRRLRHLRAVLTPDSVDLLCGGLNIDDVLDQRDVPTFEDEWLACYDRLKPREADLDEAARAELDKIREMAFLLVFHSSGHDELSGDVSDDFELIGLAVALAIEDPFAASLLAEFRAGRLAVNPGTSPPAIATQLGF
jgi:hypothetical protein